MWAGHDLGKEKNKKDQIFECQFFWTKIQYHPNLDQKYQKIKLGTKKSLELITRSIFELQKKVRGVSESAESQLFIY